MTDFVDETDDSASSSDEQLQTPEETEAALKTQKAFDSEDANSLAVTIVEVVADVEDKPAVEITDPPLQNVVDVEALSKLFSGGPGANSARFAEFRYRGNRIVVRGDAWVQVYSSGEE